MNSSAKPRADLLITGAREVLTCVPTAGDPAGRRERMTVAVAGERIVAVAPADEIGAQVDVSGAHTVDAMGGVVAPGFVDCHTHLVFGGSRAEEYAARMTLDSAAVARLDIPTGIQATVAMTRLASVETLLEDAHDRLGRMFHYGTTTVESKSGYGLTVQRELEMLRVNQKLATALPVDVVSTFLGAHDFPPEGSREAYIALLIEEMIPRVAEESLAEFCDVYCDEGYYTVAESRRILEAGLEAALRPKIHVDAYADIGGALMAAELGAISADHLNYTKPASMRRLAEAGVVGVVMPALDFAVAHPRPFAARAMLDAGMTLALATDLCPGCWIESMQLVMQLACRLYHLSPGEALYAATAGAARSLGLADRGAIAPGMLADLQVWGLPSLAEVIYRLGHNAVDVVIKRGEVYRFGEIVE
jgi:imidazolonepropionase